MNRIARVLALTAATLMLAAPAALATTSGSMHHMQHCSKHSPHYKTCMKHAMKHTMKH